tara:strand:- start:12408 stop:12797 length:390 start_codon:yes stop_codon:yes gene_type:complete
MFARWKVLSAAAAILFVASPAFAERVYVELASIGDGDPISIKVTYECSGENPTFTLVNKGDDWTKLASIEIVRIDDDMQIVRRSIRMKAGQKATFRLPAKKVGQGEFGLVLRPSWYEREAGYDARIRCN